MGKVKVDSCDCCNEMLYAPQSGIEISGENIQVAWCGKDSPKIGPFDGAGIIAPLNGRVTLTLCMKCIRTELPLGV